MYTYKCESITVHVSSCTARYARLMFHMSIAANAAAFGPLSRLLSLCVKTHVLASPSAIIFTQVYFHAHYIDIDDL